jgi:hypothetical protein
MLPDGTHTPSGFMVPHDSVVERTIKKPMRRYGYPCVTSLGISQFVKEGLRKAVARRVALNAVGVLVPDSG